MLMLAMCAVCAEMEIRIRRTITLIGMMLMLSWSGLNTQSIMRGGISGGLMTTRPMLSQRNFEFYFFFF